MPSAAPRWLDSVMNRRFGETVGPVSSDPSWPSTRRIGVTEPSRANATNSMLPPSSATSSDFDESSHHRLSTPLNTGSSPDARYTIDIVAAFGS